MAIGKVVLLSRGGHGAASRQTNEEDQLIPDGWQVTRLGTDDEPKIIAELADAEYIITQGSRPVPERYVENCKKLKLFQHGGQDVGHFPLKWAFVKGIPVANAGGENAVAVAEFTILLMLSCLKHIEQSSKNIRDGKWRGSMDRENQRQLYDKTVGIVGFGNIGRRVAKLCYSFGATIIYLEKAIVPVAVRADTKAKLVSLNELLKTSDIVSLHIPSDPGSPPIVGWEQLCLMKPEAYLINTSRGSNIDEAALIRALNEKKIAGAALDVWNPEPPNPDNPLLKMENVVATPHMAGSFKEKGNAAWEAIWRNILLVSEGKEPLNRVRP